MTSDDPYVVLGLARDASPADVARAYRREVRRHHPDTATGVTSSDERRRDLHGVQAAYEVLRDAARRADYDRRHPGPVVGPVAVAVTVLRPPPRTRPQEPPLRAGPVVWVRREP